MVVDLDLWMTKLADRIGGPIVLTSGQAGMVPYYASEEHEIRFVDLWGLTTGSVQSCAPDAVAGRYTRGTLVRLDWVLSGRLAERCGLPQPHIVHSELFNASAALLLRSRGYRIVYIQEGAPKGKAFAKEKGFGGYLAIRKDLLTTSEAEAGPTRFDWR